MAAWQSFTDGEYVLIQQFPLRPAVTASRSSLQKAFPKGLELLDSLRVPQTEIREIFSNLVGALQVHPVARKLESQHSNRTIGGELALLFERLDHDDCKLEPFLPLANAVLSEASDADIWKAAVKAIASSTRITPPSSFEPTFDGTPHTYSSSSHQGSEQTRRLLDAALRDELADCSFIKVGGFDEKYFEAKPWTARISQICEAAKGQHQNGKWEGLGDSPSERDMWDWLAEFQKEHLQNTPSIYYTTESPKDLEGSGTDRQLDIFTKSRSASASAEAKHQWAQVRVIGELSKSENFGAKFLQLARYARDVFTVQPTRTFLHAFLILGNTMELIVFDRAGSYSAEHFNIHNEPDRFIRVIAGYALMSDEELGLPGFIHCTGEQCWITADDSVDGLARRYGFRPLPIAVRRAIVSRGTCCYSTSDGLAVVKFSWSPAGRKPEAQLLQRAQSRGVEGVARLLASRRIMSVADLRRSLTFAAQRQMQSRLTDAQNSQSRSSSLLSGSRDADGRLGRSKRKNLDAAERSSSKRSRSNSQVRGTEITAKDSMDHPFQDRVLSCVIIAPAGRPLSQYISVSELLCALRDIVKAHRSLFEKGKILHRDISENNIIITDPLVNDGFTGMLIDMDLATTVGEDGTTNRSGAQAMTGTLKFMAIEILEMGLRDARRDIRHTYRHDMESLFYVFLSACINFGRSAKRPDPLRSWYTDSYKSMIRAKRGDMERGGFEFLVLTEFGSQFECAKGLASRLRELLFHKGDLFTQTDRDHSRLYGQIIDAFDQTLKEMGRP
ncbi:hypothetical protein FH972_024045 [Carpinus fangiana]|uniref:Protein kinase domain-containing protein n=1 Tax=Carpinus fangiana TaxID=176857 RepID=A0A5N6KXP7_9ROSI|nr:hypothetical protein FH972_024045 [Carpinus fangiana]